MSASEVCAIMADRVRAYFPDCEIHSIPVADGGEGTVDCFLLGLGRGEKVWLTVYDPFFRETRAYYGRFDDTAVIEMAAAAGLALARADMGPGKASTYGVGQMIAHALENGCRDIVLGLGGSCTNDAGAGMAAALGVRFSDAKGRVFIPVGETLSNVSHIDSAALTSKLAGRTVRAMCDITNPLYGENGAAYVFAPQKGALQEELPVLDGKFRAFAETIGRELGVDVGAMPGGGAAGGMGAGARAFLGAELTRGIDVVLDMVGFEALLHGCDFVFTGEGRFDAQSMGGKAVIGIAHRARSKGVPVVVVAGSASCDVSVLSDYGIQGLYTASDEGTPLDDIKLRCEETLAEAMDAALSGILDD
jgi:glycerate kinase